MFSSLLFRFSKPNSCLVLVFFFSYFHHLSCGLSQPEPSLCDPLFQCGNLTAGFPFWGESRPEACGHPSLELQCHENITSLIISGQVYRVLQLDEDMYSLSPPILRLARQDFFGDSFCNATFSGTTLTSELFVILPDYKTLFVYYGCNRRFHIPANFSCPNIGVASVHQNEYCSLSFNITVPMSYVPEKEDLSVTILERVLKEGFEVELMIDEIPCQKCKSTGGFCSYHVATPVCCKRTNSTSEPICTSVIPSASIVDERQLHCSLGFRCGNQTLNYPFWTPENKECGHPDFKVNCSGDIAEFSIHSVKFQIIEMNHNPGDVIRLARKDYRNNLCPHNPEKAAVDEEVLSYHEDTERGTFYYNCSGPRVDLLPNGYITQLQCEDYIGGPSYFVSSPPHSGNTTILDGLPASCERIVGVPVSRSALRIDESLQSLETIKKALDEGFKLRFNSECSVCKISGGACGFNQSSSSFVCYCVDEQTCQSQIVQKKPSIAAKAGIAFASGFLGLTLIAGFLLCFIIRIRGTSHHPTHHNLKALVQLKQYSYAEVKKITKSFSHTIGKGGFGTVYSGNLYDGRKVAVKILKDFKSSGEDFINEVASMSQTSHVNIVSLLGFCYEGSKRAIVYEFLENGSLDQFISEKKSLNLDVGTLYRIALGVARGLEYLHHGCKTRIVHFDIKPQNVLLDENLCPKVSDFGLAKLCEKRESILSLLNARGTIGYIAPEVTSGMYGSISHKSDVYSYGMLVLEMIGARNKKPVETAASKSSSAYFPDWIYKDLENGEHAWKFGDEITREEKEIVEKMILVGLWCIQPCPSNRPPMNRVVEMMEGSLDALEVPPKPSLHLPVMPLPESSCLSEENSNHSEGTFQHVNNNTIMGLGPSDAVTKIPIRSIKEDDKERTPSVKALHASAT